MEIGVYGDLTIIYLKPYSVYLRGTISPRMYVVRGLLVGEGIRQALQGQYHLKTALEYAPHQFRLNFDVF